MLTMLRTTIDANRHFLMSALLLCGFLADVLTFQTLDLSTSFILLAIHAVVVMAAMSLGATHATLQRFAPLALQFSFGALLSSSLVFYWFSGAFSASWPVMLLLAVLGASNEAFRTWYLRTDVRIGTFTFVLFSFFAMVMPYAFRTLAAWTFALAGVSSFTLSILLVMAVTRASEARTRERRHLGAIVGTVSVMFVALYFVGAIPPVPLAIREAGIFHNVVRQGNAYVLVGDEETFIERLLPGRVITNDADGRIYAFTTIFAPTALNTTIYHRWQRFDPDASTWVTASRLSYAIRGGREDGYRGYTYKTGLAPGEWRVIVETERGQELGRIPFTVAN